jgi:hypothetical protein
VWLDKLNFSIFTKPGCGSGWTNIVEILFLTSTKYFQSTVARADGMLIPHLRKALYVGGNAVIPFL